jgi:hypothetical protein
MASKSLQMATDMVQSTTGFSLSGPAVVALISYSVVLLAMFFPIRPKPGQEKTDYRLWDRVFLTLVMLVPISLTVYSVNCMMVGNCRTWSWIQAVLIAVWSIAVFVVSLGQWLGWWSKEDTTVSEK